eukprot:Pgem_evm1s5064
MLYLLIVTSGTSAHRSPHHINNKFDLNYNKYKTGKNVNKLRGAIHTSQQHHHHHHHQQQYLDRQPQDLNTHLETKLNHTTHKTKHKHKNVVIKQYTEKISGNTLQSKGKIKKNNTDIDSNNITISNYKNKFNTGLHNTTVSALSTSKSDPNINYSDSGNSKTPLSTAIVVSSCAGLIVLISASVCIGIYVREWKKKIAAKARIDYINEMKKLQDENYYVNTNINRYANYDYDSNNENDVTDDSDNDDNCVLSYDSAE